MAISSISSTSDLLSQLSSTSITDESDLEELEEELEEAYEAKVKALQTGSSTSSDPTTLYSSMSAASDAVSDSIEALQTAIDSGSATSIDSAMSSFVTNYNAMLSSMSSVGGVECNALLKQFQQYLSDNEDALEAAGVTISSSGKLSYSSDTLTGTDLEDLQSLFGTDSTLMKNISQLSDTVAQVASLKTSGYNSLQTLYGNSGSLSTNLTASILNAFG